ncbi:MAG TPA: hypothetical protein DEV93_14250 [Chloroflexi bacterium]|nr:hypothetical protein [Chloroflexota bacterium]
MVEIETRCGHGFLRSVVPCGICDGAERKKPAPGKIPTGEQYNFVDMSNTTVAGCRVESRAQNLTGNARWDCVCECGAKFIEYGTVLREKDKRGGVATCPDCKGKHRKPRAVGPNLKFRPIPEEHQVKPPVRLVEPLAESTPAPVTEQLANPAEVGSLLRWWRLELDAKGSVVSCTAVEHRGEAGERQFIYVEAHDQKEAGRLAWNAYCRLAQVRHRAKMTREGKCPWCGRQQDRKAGRRCSVCLAGDRARAATNKAIKAGQNVAAPDGLVTRAARLERERGEFRLQILGEVRKVAVERTPREFFQWLDEQLGIDGGQVTAAKASA